MARKYRAEHIKIFAVYRKFVLLGQTGRYLKVAYPDYKMAEDWVKNEVASCHGALKESDFIVEEMSAIMKAWQS